MTPRVYSYLRFSTPEQAAGDSRRRQSQEAEAFAAARGMTVDESLSDEGISAFRAKHLADGAALGSFLQAINIGAIAPGSILLVENVDRLSRMPVRRTAKLLLDIVEAGITIVTLEPHKEYSAATLDSEVGGLSAFLELAIHAHRAHSESLLKGKRLRKAWDAKRERTLADPSVKMSRVCPPL